MEILAPHWHSKWCWNFLSAKWLLIFLFKCLPLCHFVSQADNNNNQEASVLGISTPVFLWSSYFDMDPNFAPEAHGGGIKEMWAGFGKKGVPWQWASNQIVLEIVATMTSACLKVWGSQAQRKAKAGGSHPAWPELSEGRGPSPGAEIMGKADFPSALTPLPAYTSDTGVRRQPSPAQ